MLSLSNLATHTHSFMYHWLTLCKWLRSFAMSSQRMSLNSLASFRVGNINMISSTSFSGLCFIITPQALPCFSRCCTLAIRNRLKRFVGLELEVKLALSSQKTTQPCCHLCRGVKPVPSCAGRADINCSRHLWNFLLLFGYFLMFFVILIARPCNSNTTFSSRSYLLSFCLDESQSSSNNDSGYILLKDVFDERALRFFSKRG
mmetsp:Transcript_91816/g.143206  ORF Transcript_91816/g.143206 Transcript_91816/m.143206 type:complete len:203 (-) Transcript_91816:113-721(-)